MIIQAGREGVPERRPHRIDAGRSGSRHWWQVGGDRIDLLSYDSGWVARVRRADWDGRDLVMDDMFADEAGAIAWCRRMAEVLLSDLEGDEDEVAPPL